MSLKILFQCGHMKKRGKYSKTHIHDYSIKSEFLGIIPNIIYISEYYFVSASRCIECKLVWRFQDIYSYIWIIFYSFFYSNHNSLSATIKSTVYNSDLYNIHVTFVHFHKQIDSIHYLSAVLHLTVTLYDIHIWCEQFFIKYRCFYTSDYWSNVKWSGKYYYLKGRYNRKYCVRLPTVKNWS